MMDDSDMGPVDAAFMSMLLDLPKDMLDGCWSDAAGRNPRSIAWLRLREDAFVFAAWSMLVLHGQSFRLAKFVRDVSDDYCRSRRWGPDHKDMFLARVFAVSGFGNARKRLPGRGPKRIPCGTEFSSDGVFRQARLRASREVLEASEAFRNSEGGHSLFRALAESRAVGCDHRIFTHGVADMGP